MNQFLKAAERFEAYPSPKHLDDQSSEYPKPNFLIQDLEGCSEGGSAEGM